MKKRNLLAFSGVMAAFFTFQAGAQAQPAAGAPSPAPKPAASGATDSEDIVITATKRDEALQTVPLAVSAFTAKDRDKLGIKTVQDLTNVVPGVTYSVGLDRFYVRGIGRTSNGPGTDGGTAIYNDGVFTESSYAGATPSIFYPTIQVLRGPQVTLFGRNAIGGALLIDEKHPDRTQTEEGRVGYGAFDRWETGLRISGPLPGTDRVRYSLGANYWNQGEGYLNNVNGGKNEGGNGYYAIGSAQIEADLSPDINVWMKLETTGYDFSNRNIGISSAPFADAYAPSQVSFYPNSQWAARGDDPFTADALNVTSLGPLQTESPGFARNARYDFVGDTFTHQTLDSNYNFAAHFDWNLGGTSLKYITGAQRYLYNLYLDNDSTNVLSYTVPVTGGANPNPTCAAALPATPCATISGQTIGGYIEDRKWWTHELDWSSNGDGPLQWLAGLYYYSETEANPQYADNPGLAGTAYLTPLGGSANPSGHQYWYNQIVKSTSAAAFAQLDWKMTSQLKGSMGLRYTHDEKTVREELRALCYGTGQWFGFCGDLRTTGAFTPATDVTGVQLFGTGIATSVLNPLLTDPGVQNAAHLDPSGTGNYIRDLAGTWTAPTGSLSLDWTPMKDTLLYARFDRGYKAGAFTNALNIVRFPEANKETVNAFEVGFKARPIQNLRTNVALFYYDWSDRQTPISVPPGVAPNTGGLSAASFFINIPKSISKGAELETIWTPLTDLNVRFNYAYLQATVEESPLFVDGSIPFSARSIVGQDLPLSPRNKFSFGGDYTLRPDVGPINLSANYSWRDKDFAEVFNTPWRERPAYGTLNLTGSWTAPSGRFTIFAFGNNVTDEQTFQYITNSGTQFQNPTVLNTVPGSLTGLLGGAQITNSTVGSGLQASTYNANPLRTWGVELRAKF